MNIKINKQSASAGKGGSSNSICNVMHNLSAEIGKWLHYQPKAGEESLTDWLLYQTQLNTRSISTVQFSKPKEGKVTGADWQWQAWFLTDSGNVGLRIQAKKLSRNPIDNANAFGYPKGTGNQMTMLINDARRHKMSAMYAFYTADSHATKCMPNKTNGVFLAHAKNLKSEFILPPKTITSPSAIIALTKPLSCFFCCNATFSDANIHSVPPEYVSEFLKFVNNIKSNRRNESDMPEIPEELINQFREKHRLKLIRTFALTVFDFRSKNQVPG